ncbi:MAG TPA: AbrB family transcriptional regulator, partial [Limnochordia bacterium]|nr:AbrB family transcriptional regulator [Limnochordia bacterium]
LSMLNGLLLQRWAGVDPATGFLGSIPGAASSIVAISPDLGADPRLVALLQYLRVLLVALSVPFVVEQLVPRLAGLAGGGALPLALPPEVPPSIARTGAGGVDGAGGLFGPLTYLLLPAYALAGWALGRWLRLPSASFLGPFIVAAAGTFILGPVPFPDWLFNAALLVLGAWIGVQFDGPFIRRLGRVALVKSILVLLLVAATAAIGYAFSRLLGINPVTALLASSPGAMEAMVALSLKLGAHTPLVISMQMVRFLAMLLAGPWIARSLVRAATRNEEDTR